LEKRSGSELKAIRKQLAKLAEMTGMKIIEEEEVTASEEISTESIETPSPSVGESEKEENKVTASAPEETPPPAGWPVEAGKASDEEEVVPFVRQRKWGVPRRRLRGRIPSLSSAALRRREFRGESYYFSTGMG
jgi:hypothetical protein